jgi:hypothetical protein
MKSIYMKLNNKLAIIAKTKFISFKSDLIFIYKKLFYYIHNHKRYNLCIKYVFIKSINKSLGNEISKIFFFSYIINRIFDFYFYHYLHHSVKM